MALSDVVDRLCTYNNKLFMAQEDLYRIRRMTEEEFLTGFTGREKMLELYGIFKKACDLNVARAATMFEFDKQLKQLVKEQIEDAMTGSNQSMSHAVDQHKTY